LGTSSGAEWRGGCAIDTAAKSIKTPVKRIVGAVLRPDGHVEKIEIRDTSMLQVGIERHGA
jgi:hypothetical protein